ncbi:hypothetical protein [Sphingomonas sp. CFBP 8760]|uniref:hypothetical protein n=1 Tax=Sphingomonas sp. CFBP 8760 TaxID=2775282 RepID=UPI001786885C|nr:hypothetical protein [Sphingomonas sp. CFBP 8760]MBD8548292.1 hypothetical protein [Sphingomonas sp. CFBP 8760]
MNDWTKGLGVTQPHYSKIVGGVVPLTPQRAAVVEAWLEGAVRRDAPPPVSDRAMRIRRIAGSIQVQLRELTDLLTSEGARSRRPVKRAGKREKIVKD